LHRVVEGLGADPGEVLAIDGRRAVGDVGLEDDRGAGPRSRSARLGERERDLDRALLGTDVEHVALALGRRHVDLTGPGGRPSMVNVPSASLNTTVWLSTTWNLRGDDRLLALRVEHLALDRARGRRGRGGLHAHGDRDRRLVGTPTTAVVGCWFGASMSRRDIVDRDAGQREAAPSAGGDGLDLGAVHAHGRAGERCVGGVGDDAADSCGSRAAAAARS